MGKELIQDGELSSDLGDYFLQKKVELLVELNNKKIISEINKMNHLIGQLSNEIDSIKNNIDIANTRKTEPKYAEPVFQDIKENTKKIKSNEEVAKPRYGDYKPGDVDIEDFFYFGNKKQ